MNNGFTYRILAYTHSQFLGEKLNVGILFYFGNDTPLVFKYPSGFKRVKEVYSDFHEWQLKSNLKAIEDKVHLINDSIFSTTVDEEELAHDILRNDATVLSFSSPKTISDFTGDINTVVENLYNLYFSHYSKIDIKKNKHDEKYLTQNFKIKLLAKKPDIESLLRKDFEIKSERTSFKFEYKWQNGVPNLVKSVSFDLEEESSINSKAVYLYGHLNILAESIKNNNYNVDLLVAKPSINNKSLFKAYDNALNILQDIQVKKNIIEEKDVDIYINKVATEIHEILPPNNLGSLDKGISNTLRLPPNSDKPNSGLLL
jgi:hypothetical protein